MLKETKKIVWLGGLALLVLVIISAFTFSPVKKEKGPNVNIPVDKNTNIVTDGEYIFFNSPEGDVMIMHAFDTTPEVWVKGWKVLSASDETLVLKQNDESITVFDRAEKGVKETYDVKTDTAYCTKGAVYYKDSTTKMIMQIDRETKEEVVFLNSPVNDFLIYGDQLFVAQEEEGKGIAMFDYGTGTAALYAPEKTVKKLSFSNNMIVYTDTKDNVRRMNLNNGNDIKVKNVKPESLCFSKGVYFYVDKKWGKYKLGINDADAFR